MSADNSDPSVASVTLSRTNADTRTSEEVVEVAITASDRGGPGAASGISDVSAVLIGPDGAQAPEEPVTAVATGAGTWRAILSIPRGSQPGVYRPAVSVRDAAGNEHGFHPGAEVAPGDPTVTVTSVADTTSPQLRALQLSSKVVDTRQRARRLVVSARATDDAAGIKRILVNVAADGHGATYAFLHRVSGTRWDGTYRGSLRIPRYVGNATWRILRVGLVDEVINVRNHNARSLATLDRDHQVDRAFRVVSSADSGRPVATPVMFSSTTVDATDADQAVRVRVTARDSLSGVAQVRLRLHDPAEYDGQHDTYLTLRSGSRRNGVWQARVTLPRCGLDGRWTADLKLTDVAGNVRRYATGLSTLIVTTRDNLFPYVERTSDGSGRPVLTFSEDVTGITSASAPVRDARGAAVPGSWVCTDDSGRTVDCAEGALRRGTFLPDPASAPLGPLSVVLNPEGSLGVTDLAGNPVGRRYTV